MSPLPVRRGLGISPHRVTTAHLPSAYPFQAEGGLGAGGSYIGRDVFGGSFCFDPFALYAAGVLQNPNVVVMGDVGKGKALALTTPVPTPAGWSTMGALRAGDWLFDEIGRPCRVTHAFAAQQSRPCRRVLFSDGTHVIADADHLWSGHRDGAPAAKDREVLTTDGVGKLLGDGTGYTLGPGGRLQPGGGQGLHAVIPGDQVRVERVTQTGSVPVRCVAVDSPSALFLVGAGCVPTHNSSLVKSLLLRQMAFGRQAFVADVKGEYGALAAAIGVTPIRLGPGLPARLNPLDPGPDAAALPAGEVTGRQLRLLVALARTALHRDVAPVEHAALGLALTAVTGTPAALQDSEGPPSHLRGGRYDGGRVPTLPQVVDALLAPIAEAAATVRMPAHELAAASRDVALVMLRMCSGDLAGMFDGPTSVEVDFDGPLVVLDLADIYAHNATALPLVMACATAWLQSALLAPGAGQRFVVMEEAWALLANPGTARWLQASWKLARAWGVSNLAVLHRLSDLSAAGDDGSATEKLARGLLADAGTRVVYAQPPGEVPGTKAMLGLTGPEAELLPTLARGVGLWKVARRSFVVAHHLGEMKRPLVDTDARMVTR